ncbi:MAG: hypothetical protein NVS9B1_21760 [Candidatus Dormibacteraceae bacterium]
MTRRLSRALIFALPGMALISVTAMLVIGFGVFDLMHGHVVRELMTPDPLAAAGTLGLVGGAEGVTISIVLIVVVMGIQMTAGRYSPRIIGIFTSDPLNAIVLGFALISILFTFLVRSEVRPNLVPYFAYWAALTLAVIDFAILLPYVGYIFQVMRAETLVNSIRRRAGRDLRRAPSRDYLSARGDLLTAIAQITDIALGSVQLGDVPVSLLGIDVLRQFLVEDYLPAKRNFVTGWHSVGHNELPGSSDQVLAEVNRSRTWVEYTILSSFVDLVGLTPVYRKEVVHAVAVATRDLGLAAIAAGDHESAELSVRFFNTYLRTAKLKEAPSFASATMNEYRRLAIGAIEWRPDLAIEAGLHLLRYGRDFDEEGMPAILGAAAEDVADLAIEAAIRQPEATRRLARMLLHELAELVPQKRPIALNGVFKAVVKLTLWSMDRELDELEAQLVGGIRMAPAGFVEAALARMASLKSGLFWEVNERVVAFDWVEEPLRSQIPRLRAALAEEKSLATEQSPARRPEADPLPGERDLVQPAGTN